MTEFFYLIPALPADFSRPGRNWNHGKKIFGRRRNFCYFIEDKGRKNRRKYPFFFGFPGKKQAFFPEPVGKKRKGRIHAEQNPFVSAGRAQFNLADQFLAADRTAQCLAFYAEVFKAVFAHWNDPAGATAAQAVFAAKKKRLKMPEKIKHF